MSRLLVPVGAHDHRQGPDDAPVTLVEYGDYECEFCGEAYPILKAAQRAMGDRMRFVFRNFPLAEAHPHAARAAAFAEAAAGIGQFWVAHDLLYEHQSALTEPDLVRYGASIGLDASSVHDAAHNRSLDQKIKDDFSGGVRSGVNGTPTLFINGVRYDGELDLDGLLDSLRQAAEPVAK